MPLSHFVISVIGSLNVDLVTRTARIPTAGETLTAESFDTGFGGKGANQAVACARVSRTQSQARNGESTDVEVRMVGAVGDDQFADDFLKSLQAGGVETSKVQKLPNQKTGVAVILVESQTGENRILLSPGANYNVPVVDLLQRDTTVALFQLEVPIEVALLNMKAARERDIVVILNPAPAIPLPEDAYKGLDHLIVNETEASILSGIENPTSWNDVTSVFINRGVQNVIITLGAEGVYYQTAARHAKSEPAKVLPARKVKVVDTTAAGDTFVGAYAVSVARSNSRTVDASFDIDAAIEYANRAASETVQKVGAQSAIPWVDEVPSS
ncbi:ribokinase-like protein [Mytilinidion resinicola]|uniref:Ribokinase n=1 Tax=Mytilinidion resinicola TaxID=574789 RepID=A0A6A6Z5E4_9PEZI|nr:ribokinase-like protein [Mytilinidion resinicola]KAF2816316.1 ribokinase-like protein [Mytilinidion resinicola]